MALCSIVMMQHRFNCGQPRYRRLPWPGWPGDCTNGSSRPSVSGSSAGGLETDRVCLCRASANDESFVGYLCALTRVGLPLRPLPVAGSRVGMFRLFYMTEHSPSCCLPILLREMRSRWRGPFLPDRFRSSSRSRALGKFWAVASSLVSGVPKKKKY
jgi:hypothetical protein